MFTSLLLFLPTKGKTRYNLKLNNFLYSAFSTILVLLIYLHTFKYYSLIQSLYMYIILYLFLLYISTLSTLHTPRFRHSAFPCFPPNQIIGRKMFCLSVTKKRANISVAFCHKCGFEARILCLTLRKYLEELMLKRFSQSSYPVFAVSSNQGLSTSYLLVRENTLFPNPVNPH